MPSTSSNSLSTLQFLRLLWHFPSFAKLYWQLFNDQRVPLRAKAVLIAAVVYLLSPFDFIPELLTPVFGVVDDIAVFLVAARWFISLCPPEVVEERVKEISKMNS